MLAEGRSFSGYERNCVFLNTEGRKFANISATSGLDFIDDGRGVATVDWDSDGDLDLWISNRTAPLVRFVRNDTPSTNHYLAVRLIGKHVNRDAIGARVAIHMDNEQKEPTRLVKTLSAGSGFVAQSSKWLHFGLGSRSDIDRLVVHWPGGLEETFTSIEADRRYTIVEGSSRAELLSAPARRVNLTASSIDPSAPSTVGRIFLPMGPDAPILSYQDWNGNNYSIGKTFNSPLLINLWASWCVPCHAELNDLTENEDRLRKAGLEILALSVDGLDENKATKPSDARKHLERIGFPFPRGLATPSMLNKFQILLDTIFYRVIPLAVPTSFLVDTEGRIRAVYRGPVDITSLLADVDHLEADTDVQLARAVPFPGRWEEKPRPIGAISLARQFEKGEFTRDVVKYLRKAIVEMPDNAYIELFLGQSLDSIGSFDEAILHYRRTLDLDPHQPKARNNLGVALQTTGKTEEAINQFRKALESEPDYIDAHFNLGLVLSSKQHFNDAISHFRKVLRHDPGRAEAQLHLGQALQSQGLFEKAEDRYRQALSVNPKLAKANVLLGRLMQQQGRLVEAIGQYRRAVRTQPDLAIAHYNLGIALIAIDLQSEALKALQEAGRIDPNWPAPLGVAAWVYATTNDTNLRAPEKAIALAKQAALLNSEPDPVIFETLAAAYASQGEYIKAAEYLQLAIELLPPGTQTEALRSLLNGYRHKEEPKDQ
ncbi:MAG: Thiol:disulfide interchange protein TlpA [Candidatus Moanabacter tarae]|uniref:Thiol:disulfide interchange protein TlpA n=1 Tax=Candidatus Moanibacter tarae TaxID=2200854 RepID=A0A2Z4AJ77_9BACT|nr:MAG: Thiol:disulfide interchange protein TlpA [Candidatus Moanabacter tarae]|tara:strand:- start:13211 stop:15352 length:2142 start_codon:yes stop_codon:yes gene_type:complete